MCGISGIYSLNGRPITQNQILTQIETIVHRGPNQGGCYLAPNGRCGLGIRRLSIIDVAGGKQPLGNRAETVHLVYNGETYNYQTLRQELVQQGHQPQTDSDGEAVLHGYQAWGPQGVLQRLRGMAGFALWDEEKQQLFLGRDRFGIKPLYYASHDDHLYFGSEIKTILAQPDFPRRVNPSALQQMLTLGFVPGPATMFQGIYKLPAAHYLLAHDGQFQIKPYWTLDYEQNEAISLDEAAEQFFALLQEAIELRLMSEVPLGALLSGGLDSGTLVALVQAGLERRSLPAAWQTLIGGADNRLNTISIGFEQATYDEAPLARDLAEFIGTTHHTPTLAAADFNDYPVIMPHLEEPQCSATALPIYRLYQACRAAGLTVVLTGEGADEMLGGYHWHAGDSRVRPLLAWPTLLRRLLARSPWPSMSAPARRVLQRGASDLPTRYRDWIAVGGDAWRAGLLTEAGPDAIAQNGSGPEWASLIQALPATTAPLHQMLWLETQTRLVDFINHEVDKMSMAHSIEARVPFLDHKLWEFCATLPPAYKLKGNTEKFLLRRVMKDILPNSTRTRRKKGLAAPYAKWLQAERLPDWAEETLLSTSIARIGLFNPHTVAQIRRQHQAGEPNLGPLLMGILSTQVWFDCFDLVG